MKQFSAKKLHCNVLNFKNAITILKGVVIFLLFSAGATARTSNTITAPGKTNSVNTPPPGCQAGFTDSTSDRVAYFTSTSTDTDAGTEYRWNFGDGGISHQVNPTHRYATAGAYTVCLTIRNTALVCFDSVCHTVTITQCQAAFDTIVSGNFLTVTSTSTGVDSNTGYMWNFGDGGIGHQPSQSHTYNSPGVYDVCLAISNTTTGCTDTFCENVTISPNVNVCGADFTDSTSGQEGIFTSTSTGTTTFTRYKWVFGDGGISHQQNPIHRYSAAGTYDVCLTITDSSLSFCDSTFCDSVTVTTNVSICGADFTDSTSGQQAIFTSTSTETTSFTRYNWTFGDGGISHQQNPIHVYGAAGTYDVCLTITDSSLSFCDSTFCDSVTVTTNVSICGADFTDSTSGQQAIFTSTSTGTTSFTRYNWTFGDGGISHQQNPIHNYGTPGTYDVCLTITDSSLSFCDSTFCDSVTVTPNVSICGADFTDSTSGQQAIFTSTSTGTTSFTRYNWTFGDGGISHQQNPIHNYGTPGTYDVCLTITDSSLSFCDSTFCDSVTVTTNVSICGADFTDSTSGQQAIFTSTSTGTTSFTRYNWTFGDGGISHQQNPIHNYGTPGTYDVCLTITDSSLSFCDSTFCDSVTVTPNVSICGADFTDSTSGQQAIFTSTSTGTTTFTRYNWTFGDGGISHQQNPIHNYGTPGTYDVCLTITDSSLSFCDSTFCDSVTVTPNVSICGADFTDSTSGQQAIFTSTSTGTTAFTRYNWTFGDGGISHQQNPIHVYGAAGTYDVCLTITDSSLSFCDSTFCDSVTVTPNVSICGADFTDSTSGQQAIFTSTSTGTTSFTRYNWTFGDGGISHQQNPIHVYGAAGTYDVCLTITDSSLSFCDSTFCDSVTVTPNVSICGADFTDSTSGQQAIFTSTSTGTTSFTRYNWTFGDGGISHQQNPIHVYGAAGTYDVCLTITDSSLSFCDSAFCDSVTVTPNVSICGADFTDSTSGQQAIFTSTSTGTTSFTRYNWTFGDGGISHQQNPIHVYGAAGTYDVCLTITDSSLSFCDSAFCDSVTVTPNVSICGADFTSSSVGFKATFTSTSTDTTTSTRYVWSFGDGGLSHQVNPVHNYAAAGKYDVCLTITDSTESFCDSTFCDSVTITAPVSTCGADFTDSTSGQEAIFTSTSTDTTSATQYNWNFGDGGISHQRNPIHRYAAAGKYDVCLTILDSTESFCDSTFCDSVTVTPNVSICGANFTDSTSGQEAIFTSTSTDTTASTKYNWRFGDGGISHQQNPIHRYAAAGKYDVCLTISDSTESFCDSTFCDSVTVTPNVSVCGADFTDSTSGQEAIFTSTSTDTTSATQYHWTFGDGGISHQRNPIHRYAVPGTYDVCLTITDSTLSFCDSTFCDSVTVTPNVSICGADFINSTSGLKATFTSTSTDTTTATKYNWVFGDGGISHQVNPVHLYKATGTYDVCLTITDSTLSFCDSTFCDSVTVTAPVSVCGAAFTNSTGSLLVHFTSTSTDTTTATHYKWTFGDGGISHQVNPQHTYAMTGIYNVCLTITDSTESFCDSTFCQNISVGNVNVCGADFTNTTGSLLVHFTSTSTDTTTATHYKWTFGDGDISHQVNPQHTYSNAGRYEVCLTITDSTESYCNNTFCDSITVANVNVCGADFTNTTGNLLVYFTSTSTDTTTATKYKWTFGDGDISHQVNPHHTYATPGMYTVCLTITDSTESFCDSTFCSTITVANVNVCGADFTETSNGTLANFTSTSTDTTTATKYHWSFGDDSISHQRNAQHTYKKEGRYEVCLTITDSTETFCDSTFCDSITITAPVSVCGPDFTSAAGSKLLTEEFTSTSTDTTTATKYHWTFGDDSISHQRNPQHRYKKEGTYEVCLTLTDSTETYCDSTFCDSVKVTLPASECTAGFTWVNVKGQGIHFYSDSKDTTTATKYSWNLGDGTILQKETDPSHRYKKSGTYYVCLTITDFTENYCNSTYCDSVPFVLTGIEELSFPGTSLYYDEATSQLVLNWVGNDNVVIHLVDILGRNTQDIYTGNLTTGTYRFTVNSSIVATGIYFVHMTAIDGDKAWKIFILPH